MAFLYPMSAPYPTDRYLSTLIWSVLTAHPHLSFGRICSHVNRHLRATGYDAVPTMRLRAVASDFGLRVKA